MVLVEIETIDTEPFLPSPVRRPAHTEKRKKLPTCANQTLFSIPKHHGKSTLYILARNAAATTIQTLWRGKRQWRKRFDMKDTIPPTLPSPSFQTLIDFRLNAAQKIQNTWNAYKLRRLLQEKTIKRSLSSTRAESDQNKDQTLCKTVEIQTDAMYPTQPIAGISDTTIKCEPASIHETFNYKKSQINTVAIGREEAVKAANEIFTIIHNYTTIDGHDILNVMKALNLLTSREYGQITKCMKQQTRDKASQSVTQGCPSFQFRLTGPIELFEQDFAMALEGMTQVPNINQGVSGLNQRIKSKIDSSSLALMREHMFRMRSLSKEVLSFLMVNTEIVSYDHVTIKGFISTLGLKEDVFSVKDDDSPRNSVFKNLLEILQAESRDEKYNSFVRKKLEAAYYVVRFISEWEAEVNMDIQTIMDTSMEDMKLEKSNSHCRLSNELVLKKKVVTELSKELEMRNKSIDSKPGWCYHTRNNDEKKNSESERQLCDNKMSKVVSNPTKKPVVKHRSTKPASSAMKKPTMEKTKDCRIRKGKVSSRRPATVLHPRNGLSTYKANNGEERVTKLNRIEIKFENDCDLDKENAVNSRHVRGHRRQTQSTARPKSESFGVTSRSQTKRHNQAQAKNDLFTRSRDRRESAKSFSRRVTAKIDRVGEKEETSAADNNLSDGYNNLSFSQNPPLPSSTRSMFQAEHSDNGPMDRKDDSVSTDDGDIESILKNMEHQTSLKTGSRLNALLERLRQEN